MVAITAFPSAIATPGRRPAPTAGPRLRVVPEPATAPAGAPIRRLGRIIGTVVAALVVLVAITHLVLADPVPSAGTIPVQDAGHVVAPGETMWSIATEVAPAGEAAAYVERLVEVNGSARVSEGQVLLLPAP